MTFDIRLHEACVRVGVRYVITKFSQMDSLPNFLTHGAPLRARFARARSSATIKCDYNVHCAVKTVFYLTLGYFLRTPDNWNLFSISLEGSSYRDSTVFVMQINVSDSFYLK